MEVKKSFWWMVGGFLREIYFFDIFYSFSGKSKKVSFSGITNAIFFGDSITAGQNATLSNLYFTYLFSTRRGITHTNYGLAGKRARYVAGIAHSSTDFNLNTNLIHCMIGLNSINQTGLDSIKEIEAAYETLFLCCVFNTRTPAGHSSVTRTGSWSGFDASAVGGFYGTAALPGTSAISGTGTVEWTFSGTGFGICFSAGNALSSYGTCQVSIDGVYVKDFNLKEWYNLGSTIDVTSVSGPIAYTWHNLENTSHTVSVVSTGTIAIDYFTTLKTPANSPSIIYGTIPKSGFSAYFRTYNFASDVIKRLAGRHWANGYKVGFIDLDYAVGRGGYDTDLIHWTDNGHNQYSKAIDNILL